MTVILQDHMPEDQRLAAAFPLPKMQPVTGPLLRIDEAYGAQVAEKLRLIAANRSAHIAVTTGAEAAVAELYDFILAEVETLGGFEHKGDEMRCPDGRRVLLDRTAPFETLAALVQEDLCILQKRGDEHVLTAALLGFPAAWTLGEKIGYPLTRIHMPVHHYDASIAARVQRFFDGVQVGRPLWRANLLRYQNPELYQAHSEANPRPVGTVNSPYIRSERQSVFRLPETDAVVFSIKTVVIKA